MVRSKKEMILLLLFTFSLSRSAPTTSENTSWLKKGQDYGSSNDSAGRNSTEQNNAINESTETMYQTDRGTGIKKNSFNKMEENQNNKTDTEAIQQPDKPYEGSTPSDEYKKQLIATVSKVCGQKFVSCLDQYTSLNMFNEASPCRSCSCDTRVCHLNRNCCPDIDILATGVNQRENTEGKTNENTDAYGADNKNEESDNDYPNPLCTDVGSFLQAALNSMDFGETNERQHVANKGETSLTLLTDAVKHGKPSAASAPSFKDREVTNFPYNETSTDSWIYIIQNDQPILNSTEENKFQNDQKKYLKTVNKDKPETQESLNGNKNAYKMSSDEPISGQPLDQKLTESYLNAKTEVLSHSGDNAKSWEYIMYQKCPKGFPDSAIVQKCEDENSTYLQNYIPVSTWLTYKIFKNKWCAICHNITYFQQWRLLTDCLNLYTINYLPSDISGFQKITQNCTVKLVPSKGTETKAQLCNNRQEALKNTIEKCNTTGLWKLGDPVIKDLCEQGQYQAAYTDILGANRASYKNIFCYVCNTHGDLQALKYTQELSTADQEAEFPDGRLYREVYTDDQAPSGLSTDENSTKACQEGKIQDVYSNSCIEFQCPIYQTAMSTICFDNEWDVTGLVVGGTILLQPLIPDQNHHPVSVGNHSNHKPVYSTDDKPVNQKPVYIHDDKPVNQDTTETKYLGQPVNNNIMEFGYRLLKEINYKLNVPAKGCDVKYAKLVANDWDNSNSYHSDSMYLEYKLGNTKLCSVKTLLEIFTKIQSGKETIELKPYKNHPQIKSKLLTPASYLSPAVPSYSQSYSLTLYFGTLQKHMTEVTLLDKKTNSELRLEPNFNCPVVRINISYYRQLVAERILQEISPEILASRSVTNNGLLSICFHDYILHWLRMTYPRQSEPKEPTLSVKLSIISTLVSMVSTLIVLMTYFLFSELRFISGKLFMILCFNLFIAQGLYSFGIDQGVDNIICSITGMGIHFFWLSTIFSMSSCLWFMLKNFQKPLEAASREIIQSRSNYEVFKNILYCYIMATICVVVNVILSRFLFHDDHYGYGGDICYINTKMMRFFAFALPIAIVLLINFIMFLMILSKIRNVVYKKYCSIVHDQISIFLRLSTITGCYWGFGFIYELTDILIFEYLFIILNAGQGFFLMFSFVFNKRVLCLYTKFFKKLCYVREERSLSDTTS